MPIAASRVSSLLMCMPSIWIASRSNCDRSADNHAFIRSADSATNRRDTADFDTPAPGAAAMSPSGRRTARPKRRVDTLISIRFIAHYRASPQPAPPATREHNLSTASGPHARSLDPHLAAVEAQLADGAAPAIATSINIPAVACTAQVDRVLLHHVR
jgi:hypothetical protein